MESTEEQRTARDTEECRCPLYLWLLSVPLYPPLFLDCIRLILLADLVSGGPVAPALPGQRPGVQRVQRLALDPVRAERLRNAPRQRLRQAADLVLALQRRDRDAQPGALYRHHRKVRHVD